MLLPLVQGGLPIVLFIDETLERRRGEKIKAKGHYRDAVRSSKAQLVKASGLKWLTIDRAVCRPMEHRSDVRESSVRIK